MKKALLFALAAILATAPMLSAEPLTLYKVELAAGVDAYRFAADHALPAYHIGATALLVGARPDARRHPQIAGIAHVYSGDARDLRWVGARRRGLSADPGLPRLFAADGMFLVRAREIDRTEGLDRGSFLVTDFPERPVPVDTRSAVINPGLAYDPAIAALAQQVTVEHFRADVESLQAFNTRNTGADANGPAAAWIRDQFLSFGIADVVIDSYIDPGFSSGIKIRNVIATIPGTVDTHAVYVVGGHYDTSVWPFNPADPWAPGADDNGSGTAAAIEMARVLAANPPAGTVKFIAFDCEEWGLYGSARAANAAAAAGEDIGCMLNYDMIGAANNDSVFVSKVYPGSEDYAQLLGRSATWYGRTNDTGLVTEYNSVYLNGSDSWRYYNAGYKVTYSEELNFSEHYHMVSDSTAYMNMRYATSIVRAGIGMLATLANYPQPVRGLAVRDLGDGASLQAVWQAAATPNVTGYRVYWGRGSGGYADSATVAAPGDTIGGLLADSLYYVAVAAVDGLGRTSPFLSEASGTPRQAPQPPAPVIAAPVAGGVRIEWRPNAELDLAGYKLYRAVNDTAGYVQHPGGILADTGYTDGGLSGADRYYYKVRAVDRDSNQGAFSDRAYGRPYTFDQGILLVDETKNWTTGSYPRDTTQDNLYHALLAGYALTDWEYDSLVRQPVEADFAPYSTVVWHTDDRDYFLGWSDTTALRRYLGAGGNLWLTGWLPLADMRNNTTYPASFGAGSFVHDCLKISQAAQTGVTADTFIAARGVGGYPDVLVDSAKVPLGTWKGTLRYIEGLTPVSPAEAVSAIDLRNDGSAFEGQTCGIRYLGSDYKLAYTAFPLSFMRQDQARALAVRVLTDFGEPSGVAAGPSAAAAAPALRLEPGRPNPFTRSTIISYQLANTGQVEFNVYNVAGQKVRTLVSGPRPAGRHSVRWDGRDGSGRALAAGVYLARLDAGGLSQAAKLLLVR